jgi:hypothetical protein
VELLLQEFVGEPFSSLQLLLPASSKQLFMCSCEEIELDPFKLIVMVVVVVLISLLLQLV